ncbi:MAG TPA: hypothetical protein ENG87_02185 [Candidatus Pacearchaeota archaeon]|nr:hypothetical protein [Candidatus Pacearchaeota archaeon]
MKKTKELKKKKYNCENKNRIRQIIVDEIRKRDINNILALESPEFLFSKLLPDKKIIVFENDADVMKKMEKKSPKNVELIFGNIHKFGVLNAKIDSIWLDFTGTWYKEQENIVRLKDTLKETKLFILTLCLREKGYNKNIYDYYLINKIQELTGINWKVIYGENYYDSVQMVTIILENTKGGK